MNSEEALQSLHWGGGKPTAILLTLILRCRGPIPETGRSQSPSSSIDDSGHLIHIQWVRKRDLLSHYLVHWMLTLGCRNQAEETQDHWLCQKSNPTKKRTTSLCPPPIFSLRILTSINVFYNTEALGHIWKELMLFGALCGEIHVL